MMTNPEKPDLVGSAHEKLKQQIVEDKPKTYKKPTEVTDYLESKIAELQEENAALKNILAMYYDVIQAGMELNAALTPEQDADNTTEPSTTEPRDQ